MTARGGIYEGPGGQKLHGDGTPVDRPAAPPTASAQVCICTEGEPHSPECPLAAPAAQPCASAEEAAHEFVKEYGGFDEDGDWFKKTVNDLATLLRTYADSAVAEALRMAAKVIDEEIRMRETERDADGNKLVEGYMSPLDELAKQILALTPATVRLASEERELVARIEEQRDHAHCDCLHGPCRRCYRLADLTCQLADLRAGRSKGESR